MAEKRRAIVVDDEPITRIDLRQMLTEMGFTVVGEAADGFDAIALCRRCHLRHRHDSVNNVQGVKRLTRASDTVSLFFQPGRAHFCVGITHICVLQLSLLGFLSDIQNEPAVLNSFHSQKP